MNKSMLLLGMLLITADVCWATEAPTLELGKALFVSPELGTSKRSCSSCHPQGKGLEMLGKQDDAALKATINACLRDALGADMISPESQEMEALLGYIRSFQKTTP